MNSAARHCWTGVLCILFLAGADTAWAHRDPVTCTKPGVTIVFTTFRADGVTEIASDQKVSPCETVVYQATLSKPSDPLVCAFQAGRIFIVTPDGVSHDVTPAGGIPCVGGTDGTICDPTVDHINTQKVTYVVNPANEIPGTSELGATVNYGTTTSGVCVSDCGTEHAAAPDLTNKVSATLGSELTVQPCPAPTQCIQEMCDATHVTPLPGATPPCPAGGCFGMGACVATNVSNSTPCDDTDGNACTTAGCDGQGNCDQNHLTKTCPAPDECNGGCDTTTGQCTPKTSTPCTDSDGNTCTTAGCEIDPANSDHGVCVQTHMSASDSTPCADTDGNNCTTAGCNGHGVCDQNHMFASNSTPCPDSDGNFCTTAGCNGQGVCDQTHATKQCPAADQCNGVCDTTTGKCTPKTSTPCTDSDGNTCTTAGCELSPTNPELGVCVQTHMLASNNTPCGTDQDTTDCLLPACVSGVCQQKTLVDTTKVNKPCTSTSDTPNNCLLPCCDASGVCAESAAAGTANPTQCALPDSSPCSDTDSNACTTAGCNGTGVCDQNHSAKVCPPADQCNGVCDTTTGKCTPKTSTPCTDSDGNACTTAGCEISPTNPELGVCVQTHMFASNSTPCADTDNNACTTAGCNGQGVCDQNHMMCALGCFTRTPGFWGTHPTITQAVLGSGLPSCGLVVNTTAAATPVSATEDICSVGTDSKTNHTSPQQVQLIRQCMAAALNLAATARAPQPGDCNSVAPGITQQFNTCCTGPTSVCDSGEGPGAIDASGCIGILDSFNSLETTFDIGIGQGSADPSACQASKNNGFLNPGRNLGPAS